MMRVQILETCRFPSSRATALLVVLALFNVSASGLELERGVVTFGGGASSGSSYSVVGAVTSPVGSLEGGDYSVVGGFWGAVSLVLTPDAPLLEIARAADGASLILSWPADSETWVLQRAPSLDSDVEWVAVASEMYSSDGTTLTFTIASPQAGDQAFFRLAKSN